MSRMSSFLRKLAKAAFILCGIVGIFVMLAIAFLILPDLWYRFCGSHIAGTLKTISSDKTIYGEGDTIRISIEVASPGDRTHQLLFPDDLRQYVGLSLLQWDSDRGERKWRLGAHSFPEEWSNVVKVKPGQAWTVDLNGRVEEDVNGDGFCITFTNLGTVCGLDGGGSRGVCPHLPSKRKPHVFLRRYGDGQPRSHHSGRRIEYGLAFRGDPDAKGDWVWEQRAPRRVATSTSCPAQQTAAHKPPGRKSAACVACQRHKV
jgi:hypothetical protein